MRGLVIGVALLAAIGVACGDDGAPSTAADGSTTTGAPTVDEAADGSFSVAVDGVEPGADIPVVHTCDGADEAPRLSVAAPPEGVGAYALVVEDPDAPTAEPFVHWVVGDIAAAGESLDLAAGVSGVTDFGRDGWGGPCPPPGDPPHEYAFVLYALDGPVGIDPGATAAELRAAIEGRVLAQAQVSVFYGR